MFNLSPLSPFVLILILKLNTYIVLTQRLLQKIFSVILWLAEVHSLVVSQQGIMGTICDYYSYNMFRTSLFCCFVVEGQLSSNKILGSPFPGVI